MICDLCGVDYTKNPEVGVHVFLGELSTGAYDRRLGSFCSRFCAIHALVGSVSRDWADGAAPRVWRDAKLEPP